MINKSKLTGNYFILNFLISISRPNILSLLSFKKPNKSTLFLCKSSLELTK